MVECSECDVFAEGLYFGSPREYLGIVCQLIELVSQGTFWMVHASRPLEDMFSIPMPEGCIFHHFQCAVCGRGFQLFADTYHGNSNWTPGDVPASNRDATDDVAKSQQR